MRQEGEGVTVSQSQCQAIDSKGLRCERDAHTEGLHQRHAVPGELPYVEGPNNSIVSWPPGPPPRRIPK